MLTGGKMKKDNDFQSVSCFQPPSVPPTDSYPFLLSSQTLTQTGIALIHNRRPLSSTKTTKHSEYPTPTLPTNPPPPHKSSPAPPKSPRILKISKRNSQPHPHLPPQITSIRGIPLKNAVEARQMTDKSIVQTFSIPGSTSGECS
jgi:hypothetical protein